MICAMGAISILGFIVWAHYEGLLMRKHKVIKYRHMLETLLMSNSNAILYIIKP
jgi:hypothetical protein